MELKLLKIKNIASIEQAEIDFCKEPLGKESIFLICGETGAGKSTILDAICLALYNKAPRLNVQSQERIGDDAVPADKREHDGDMGVGDTRQFLRKGTAEASATLVFTGLDGIEYTAIWSVRRARKKIDGKIQSPDWILSWGENGYIDRQHDVRTKVEEVTGMTFDQYCRTSMLAQGEFSKFLKSNENDKAAILEKLTRTDIYARIGARIAQKAKEHKDAYLLQVEKISGIILLDAGERKTLQEELSAKEALLGKTALEKESSATKLIWLRTKSDLEAKADQSRLDLENEKSAVTSESFLRDEKLCKDWDATSNQRAAMSRRNELQTAMDRLAEESDREMRKFMSLSADLAAGEGMSKETLEECTVLKQRLDVFQPYASMFSSFKTIKDRLQSIVSDRRISEDLRRKLKCVEEALENDRKELEARKKTLSEMQKDRDLSQKILDERNAVIAASGMEAKTRAKNELEEKMSAVKEAGLSVRELQKAGARKSDTLARLASCRKSLEEAQTAAQAARTAYELADRLYAESSALADRMKDSVDSWARVARTRLHPGDTCPLCGQKIIRLTSDAEFEAMLAPLKADLERKSEERKSAEETRNNTLASLQAWKNSVGIEAEKLELAEKEYSDAASEAEAACASLHISPDGEDILERLRDLYRRMESEREALGKSIDEISESEKTARELQEAINRKNKSIEIRIGEIQAATENVSTLEREAASLQAGIESALRNAGISMSLAGRDIVMNEWQDSFNADPEGFISRLEEDSVQYSADKEKLSVMTVSLEKSEAVLKNARAARQSILEVFPEWEHVPGVRMTSRETDFDTVSRKWAELHSRVCSVKDREKTVKDELKLIEESLDEFFAGNTVSESRLNELMSVGAAAIGRIKEAVAAGKSSLKTAESVLMQRENDLKKHSEAAPEMKEGDTAEALALSVAQKEQEINVLNQEIGSMRQKLLTDEENIMTAGKEKDEAERLLAVSEQWEKLSRIFGDAEGRKFKKIAQAYVMTELVRNANVYLGRLSDRYMLDSQPASLTLTVRDMYQGGAMRSVNTLSGGETFLVSLSLALGLSSLSGGSLKVNILFIDEGFGTLSSDYLDAVMEALENLHQMGGRKVGIISHVESLRERIPVQIQVKRQGNSASTVKVVSAR